MYTQLSLSLSLSLYLHTAAARLALRPADDVCVFIGFPVCSQQRASSKFDTRWRGRSSSEASPVLCIHLVAVISLLFHYTENHSRASRARRAQRKPSALHKSVLFPYFLSTQVPGHVPTQPTAWRPVGKASGRSRAEPLKAGSYNWLRCVGLRCRLVVGQTRRPVPDARPGSTATEKTGDDGRKDEMSPMRSPTKPNDSLIGGLNEVDEIEWRHNKRRCKGSDILIRIRSPV